MGDGKLGQMNVGVMQNEGRVRSPESSKLGAQGGKRQNQGRDSMEDIVGLTWRYESD